MDIEKILTSEIVDLSSIKSFFSTEKEALIELISVYISDTAPKIEILEKSMTQVDYGAVKSTCHFLKSSFGLMGIKCFEEVATLEKLAENRESEAIIVKNLTYIVPICKESIEEYQRILTQLQSL